MTENGQTWLVLGGFGVAAALCAGIAIFIERQPLQPPVPTTAQIIDVKGGHLGRAGHEPSMIVTYRAANGLIGRGAIPFYEFTCREGDTVSVVRQGVTLELDAKACRVQR